jgi:selenium-binding protein 1
MPVTSFTISLECLLDLPVPKRPASHVERRHLVVPGLRSSRIHNHRHQAKSAPAEDRQVIEPAELAERANYSRPHTVHCGPEGIYVTALGDAAGKGPGGIFLME